jgi:phosphoesterase RecJ-like protein
VLGLWQFLKKAMPEKQVDVLLERPAPIFAFIEGAGQIISEEPKKPDYDVMIVADSTPDRTGLAAGAIEAAKKVINIDHHISNPGCGDVSIVVPDASSTAEVIYDIISYFPEQKAYMDRELAQTLYIGIIHDSGVLQYSNTSPRTLRIVAELISYGFDFPRLIDETFYERTQVQSKVLAQALLDAQEMLDGKCMVSVMTRKTMEQYGAEKQDLSGIVSQLRLIKGVRVAVFIYEIGTQQYKVSLRSCDDTDVSQVAASFGGGGHVRAAGCTVEGSADEVTAAIISRLTPVMEESV